MTAPLDATASARIAAAVRGAHWLIELDFTPAAGGTQRFTTAPVDIPSGGNVYTAAGNLVEVSSLAESEDASAQRLTLSFSVVNQAMLAATMGNVPSYRGRAARLALQLLDDKLEPAGAAVPRWAGYMDKVAVPRKRADPKGGVPGSGRIELICVRAGMARARNAVGLRLTHAQQQQEYPGDRGLEYVQPLVEQPTLWLSKQFQEV